MRWLVFDCPSGASGDMTLGALVDLGVPLERLRDALATLPLAGYTLRAERVQRSSIAATQVHVNVTGAGRRSERHVGDIVALLQAGKLSPRALAWAIEVFRRLAVAEAAVHGVPVRDVHFHEVGGVDAIVDIAGACAGIDILCREHGVEGARVAQIRLGRGVTRTEHGTMPVPPPAVLQLLEGYPLSWSDTDGERVTPTGAAILATFARPLAGADVRVLRTGYGAGTKEYPDAANVLRLILGEPAAAAAPDLPSGTAAASVLALGSAGDTAHDHAGEKGQRRARREPVGTAGGSRRRRVAVLRTQIDDMVPELLGHLMARLFAAGALDVYFTSVQMKKNRPATQLTVIARPEDAEPLSTLVLTESSTLGVRVAIEERIELPRRTGRVRTPFGAIDVKIAMLPDGQERVVPEYESVRGAAESSGASIVAVYNAALAADLEA